jgi:hypothetical protein
VDVDVDVQLHGEPHDRIVVRMTASQALLVASILDSDARTIAIHFSILAQLFSGRWDRPAVRPESRSLSARESGNRVVERIGIEGFFQRTANLRAIDRSIPIRST